MPWWGWLVVGIGLLGVEMFVVDAQFYLVFVGVAAVFVGLLDLAIEMPEWIEWLIFAVVSILTMVAFRRRVYERIRGRVTQVPERVAVGDRVIVTTRLEPGQMGRIEYRGSSWTARNADRKPLEVGSEALISQVDGLTLHLTAAPTA
jgi:inner membrane protein